MADKVIVSEVRNKVVISEMLDENINDDEYTSDDVLYEVTFHGAAFNYGFNGDTEHLTAEDAFEIAENVARETSSKIIWEGDKPGWVFLDE